MTQGEDRVGLKNYIRVRAVRVPQCLQMKAYRIYFSRNISLFPRYYSSNYIAAMESKTRWMTLLVLGVVTVAIFFSALCLLPFVHQNWHRRCYALRVRHLSDFP